MFFEQGLSGLNAAAQTLNVIGKNIANGSTTGYKTASIDFTNVMSNTLNTANSGVSLQTGAGPQSSNIQQLFTQGTITSTNNPLDVAINGKGFFQLQDPTTQQLSYTRDGQFRMDAQYNIVNAIGQQLTGYAPNVVSGNATPINLGSVQTMATGSPTSKITANITLPSSTTATIASFNPADSSTYNWTASKSVTDSNGNSQNLQLYFVQSTPPPASSIGLKAPTWAVYATTNSTGSDVINLGTVSINTSSGLISSADTVSTAVAATATSGAIPPSNLGIASSGKVFSNIPVNGSASDVISVDLGNLSVDTTGLNSLAADGYPKGSLTSFNIGADGKIMGTYSNGQNRILGSVALASFTSVTGLQALGSNAWIATAAAGKLTIGVPGDQQLGLGALQSSALESSNEDQTADMVALLAAQRAYQANAQTIKAEDQIAQTLVNLG